MLLFDQSRGELGVVARRDPVHVRDFVGRPQVRRRVAMAVEAPAHRKRLGLVDDLHLVDVAVAADAADPGVDVNAVVEEGIVGQVVHPHPAQRRVVGHALAQRLEQLAVALDHRVAIIQTPIVLPTRRPQRARTNIETNSVRLSSFTFRSSHVGEEDGRMRM